MIFYVSGNKGGVGKSLVATALIDALVSKKCELILVDADNHNPDVFKAHEHELQAHALDLSSAPGWIDLVNLIDTNRDKYFVINTPAGNNTAVQGFAETLNSALPELGIEILVLWVINRQKDSLEALADFREMMPSWPIRVVRNNHFADPQKFERFNDSFMRIDLESAGSTAIDFPDIADRCVDQLNSHRMSVERANKVMNLGNRMELQRWRNAVHKQFAGLIK